MQQSLSLLSLRKLVDNPASFSNMYLAVAEDTQDEIRLLRKRKLKQQVDSSFRTSSF